MDWIMVNIAIALLISTSYTMHKYYHCSMHSQTVFIDNSQYKMMEIRIVIWRISRL